MTTGEDLTLTIYGLPVDNGSVDLDLFKKKLDAFVSGIKAADCFANDKSLCKHLITDLSYSSAKIKISERQRTKKAPQHSASRTYMGALEALYNGERGLSAYPETLIKHIRNISKDAGKTFSHGEIAAGDNVIRIDDFLARKAENALININNPNAEKEPYYKGLSFGSFDGMLQNADSRGRTLRGIITLTAGGIEIDCTIPDTLTIRECFDVRAKIEGYAHYDGISQLPTRIDIKRIAPIKKNTDLIKWRGAFTPPAQYFEDKEW